MTIKDSTFKSSLSFRFNKLRLYSTQKDFITYNNLTIHSSFSSILNKKSLGAILLTELILNLHKQNVHSIPLFLTPLAIKASHDLIKMINLLQGSSKKNSKLKKDNILLDLKKNHLNPIIRYNMESCLKTYNPIKSYNVPILDKKVEDADCSGVYVFLDKTGKKGIGSDLSCRDRLQDHMNSFYGHRPRTFLHNWVIVNGGIKSVKWAPIITYDNIVQEWYNRNFDSPLSLGSTKILQGFGQYTIRLLEQCLYTYNKPFLSMYYQQRGIIFFNFSFKAE